MFQFFFRDIYCHKIGYVKTPRVRAAPIPRAPPAMLPIAHGPAEASEGSAFPAAAVLVPPLRSDSTYLNAVPIAVAPASFHAAPAGTEGAAPRTPTGYSPPVTEATQVNQTTPSSIAPGADFVETRKRNNDDEAPTAPSKKQATHDLAGSSSANDQVSTKRDLAAHPCCMPCLCTLFTLIKCNCEMYIVLKTIGLWISHRCADTWGSESSRKFPS